MRMNKVIYWWKGNPHRIPFKKNETAFRNKFKELSNETLIQLFRGSVRDNHNIDYENFTDGEINELYLEFVKMSEKGLIEFENEKN